MKRFFMLHTMPFVMDKVIGPLEREFLAEHPDVTIETMLDTSLLADTMTAGSVTPDIAARLLAHVQSAERAGADLLLLTCTSMGEGMAHVRDFSALPTLCITEPLVEEALDLGRHIGIVGTVPTSPAQIIAPLLDAAGRRDLAESDLTFSIEVVEEAFAARGRGDTEEHDRLVAEAVARLADQGVDCVVFAQASMSGAEVGEPPVPTLRLGPSAFAAAGKMLAGA